MTELSRVSVKDAGYQSTDSHEGELLRSNELLRDEIDHLRAENAQLQRRLTAAALDRQADRESRRAALNLMEDAIAARQAEANENTERRRVEDQLREANRRKDEFLATLAHELRNPLAPIRNSLHILRMAGADAPLIERVLDMLERQVVHLVRLVDDLLEVSRVTCGKIQLRKERIELAAVVRSAVETTKPMIESAQQQLAISLPAEPLTLDADSVRLTQVISNLLNNAVKYTDPGGQIWVTARRDDNDVLLSVRDTGVGISEDMLPLVFDMFTQIDRTLGRDQGGLGIGLTLVRDLVQSHGGAVTVNSAGLGCGSEFTVRLPLVDGRAENESPTPRSESHLYVSKRILIVDDNRDAADSLATLLKFMGADVQVANDGPAGLEAIRRYQPSVVFLDIGMPGLDGYEVARRVRQLPESYEITLVALTGWGQDDDRRRTKEFGFDFHLLKPVEITAVQTLLGSLPPQSRNS